MSRKAMCAALAGLLSCTPVMAGLDKGNGELGVDLVITDFDSEVSDETGFGFSIRGGYHLTRLFELEGQFSSSDTEEDFCIIFCVDDVDTTLRTLFVNGVFNFHPTPRLVPYVLGGIGRAELEFEGGGIDEDDSSTAFQVGGGLRLFLRRASPIALRFEISRLREETFDEASNHTNFTFGVTFRLGST